MSGAKKTPETLNVWGLGLAFRAGLGFGVLRL